MARALSTGMATAVARVTGARRVHLVDLQFVGAALYLTDASQDITTTTPAQTWTAVGGAMTIGAIEETLDGGATSVDLEFSGVDQGIITSLLTDQWRGQTATIYLCHFESTGAVTATPLCIFAGRMGGGWRISTATAADGHETTVRISTTCHAYAADLDMVRGRRTNPMSHARIFSTDGASFRHTGPQAGQVVSWGPMTGRVARRGGQATDTRRPSERR